MSDVDHMNRLYRRQIAEIKEADELLTIDELATWIKLNPKTIRNKMSAGIFRKGIHYYSPHGLRTRFIRSAILLWLKEEEVTKQRGVTFPLPDEPDEAIRRA